MWYCMGFFFILLSFLTKPSALGTGHLIVPYAHNEAAHAEGGRVSTAGSYAVTALQPPSIQIRMKQKSMP